MLQWVSVRTELVRSGGWWYVPACVLLDTGTYHFHLSFLLSASESCDAHEKHIGPQGRRTRECGFNYSLYNYSISAQHWFSLVLSLPQRHRTRSTVLRGLSNAGADATMDILVAIADFWGKTTQMARIVFDKLMQYQIADPRL